MKPCLELMDRFYFIADSVLCGVAAWFSAAAFLVQVLFYVPVPVFHRRHIIQLFKCAAEMFDAGIAYSGRNIFYGHIAVFQESPRFFHTDFGELLLKCFSGFFTDEFTDIGSAQVELFCHILFRDGLVICLHKVDHIHQPFVFTGVVFFYLWQLIHTDTECVDRCRNDILVDADAPVSLTLTGNADIGNSLGG